MAIIALRGEEISASHMRAPSTAAEGDDLLSRSAGRSSHSPPPVDEMVPVDPCADLPMVTLSISESSSSFRFEPNVSYRLRLDGVDMETAKSVVNLLALAP
ncbi:hypothetical protein Y032_0191g1330 [Ancylostoma ceylanicum]|uniref:Uncharacterized protein n=1 Tax=Ancylostoma ceylanicum TaxID=53326 RepID=A0A016SPU9_9BILA|nr:hypothetical protein Y032_0191g1330 [Ancylostoma ceylanicum]